MRGSVASAATIHPMRIATLVLLAAAAPILTFAQTSAAPEANSPTARLLASLQDTKRIGDVALSLDGRNLAVVLGGDLVLESVGSPERHHTAALCTAGKSSVSALSWSPDNTHLAILADCSGSTEVLLTTANAGAKPRVLVTLHGFAKALEYAPDGKSLGLLYVEGATRPSGALAAMKPPSGEIGVEGLEIQRVATIDAASGSLRQVTPPELHVYEFSFAPNSQQLAFVAAAPPGENNWWVAKLYTQALGAAALSQDSQPKTILDPNTVAGPLHGLQIAVPRWSPDSKQIALIGGLMSDQGATGGDLYVVPTDGRADDTNPVKSDSTSMQWIDWLPSGKLLATEIVDGAERIDEIDLAFPPGLKTPRDQPSTSIGLNTHIGVVSARPVQTLPYSIGDGRLAGSFAVSRDGSVAAWSASSYAAAPEVYAGPLTQPLAAVTHLNAASKPSWGKTESVHWTNDGFKVQGWLLYPANYDPAKRYGLIVMVHGGPSSAVTPRWPRAGFGAAPLAAAGYFVLEPNPRGSYGEGEAFTEANRKDFGYGDLRDILAGVDAVERQIPAIDDHRLGLTGWSYGGFMSMFAVTQTHRFRAAVAGAGIADWLSYYGENSIDQWMTPFFGDTVYKDPAVYAKSSAIHYIDRVTTPTLVVVGDRDGECPAPQSFEFWHALKAFHIPTTLVVYPNEGHGFVDPEHQRDVLERSIRWFNQYLQ